MKKSTSLKSLFSIFILTLFSILYSCQDTRSFENVTKVKHGMTISEIESIMGTPHNYSYINDSTETRSYVYDEPTGMDKYLKIVYQNSIAIEIKDNGYNF